MSKRVSSIIAAVIVIIAVILVVSLRKGGTVPGSVVRIAGNIPLSGPTASFSGEWGNGLVMGIDDACKETGFPRNAFEIDMQDNQGQPAQAATIVQKQAITGFDVYASGTTQMTKAVAPTVDRTSALHLLVSYDAHLTGEAPNRMRILTHFKAEGPVYVEYARMRQAKRVVSLTLNVSEIQDEFSDYVEPGLKALGAGFSREIFGFDNNDFRTLALKAKQFRPDLIFVSGFSIHVLAVLRALRAEGMITDGNVLSIMDFNELLAGSLSTGELAGVAYIAPPFGFPENRPASDEWRRRFRDRFGRTSNFIPAFAYDTGRILVQAKVKAGKVTKDSVRAQLPFKGVSGTVSVDDAGDLSTPLGILKVEASGEIVRLK
jgi:ABC-type branched-subunit amino acid transport system substrate-binding protein